VPIVGYWPRTVALGIVLVFFSSRRLVSEGFPFSLSTAELGQVSVRIGETRRICFRASPILSCSLCSTNTIVAAVFIPITKSSEFKKSAKNPDDCASHISGGCDTVLIIISADDIYYANIIGATLLAVLYPCFQINLAKLIRNGNMVTKDTITKR
jgi:hypothetical protein